MNIFVIGYGQAGGRIGDLFENQGPFGSHRRSVDEMEYTTLPDVLLKQQHRYRNADFVRDFSEEKEGYYENRCISGIWK